MTPEELQTEPERIPWATARLRAGHGRVSGGVLDQGAGVMSAEPRDEMERRWQSLGRGWEPLLRCPLLHALVMLWVRMPAQSLRDVAQKYVESTRTDIPAWLDFAPVIAACFQALLPVWRNDCPNIMDSAAWEHDEALRICAMVHELRRRAFAEAARYHLRLVPNA